MRVLEYVAVIMLTTTVVVSLMTGFAIYQEQRKLLSEYERQFMQLAQACGVQVY